MTKQQHLHDKIGDTVKEKNDIIAMLSSSFWPFGNRKEVQAMELLISFFISVLAGVVANYIFKWLDRDKHGNDVQ